jgi:hypothetical protein
VALFVTSHCNYRTYLEPHYCFSGVLRSSKWCIGGAVVDNQGVGGGPVWQKWWWALFNTSACNYRTYLEPHLLFFCCFEVVKALHGGAARRRVLMPVGTHKTLCVRPDASYGGMTVSAIGSRNLRFLTFNRLLDFAEEIEKLKLRRCVAPPPEDPTLRARYRHRLMATLFHSTTILQNGILRPVLFRLRRSDWTG